MNEQLIENEVSIATDETPSAPKRFRNSEPVAKGSFKQTLKLLVRFLTEKKINTIPTEELPVKQLTQKSLLSLSDDNLHFIKLGHSSILLKIMGEFWFLDPVFSKRASPFSFIGPKRFHQTPITLDELPPIDKVLISHDHYDHLDKQAVAKLADKTKQFLVPLGVDSHLKKWGIPEGKILSFDWWQSHTTGDNKVVFTPAKHFSGRGITDGNASLWGSWVIDTPVGKVFFSGDSGYFSGFAEIGRKYGPFDVTFVETGAYDKDWSAIHMTPEQSVQAHLDLKGQVMVPIHNSTFDLAFHAWYDPLERVLSAANEYNVELSTPVTGKILDIRHSLATSRWWQPLMPLKVKSQN